MTNHNGNNRNHNLNYNRYGKESTCIWKDLSIKYPSKADKKCLKCFGYDLACRIYLSNAEVEKRRRERSLLESMIEEKQPFKIGGGYQLR